jgi:hypothetical protein
MKRFVLILLCVITLATAAMGQRRENQLWFKHAVGFRYELLHSGLLGLSYERFWSRHNSFEIIGLSIFSEGLEAAGFYKYTSIFPIVSPQWRWFVGGGIHLASWFHKKPKDPFVVGVDAIAGIGFVFHEIPIGISVDWRPQIDLYTQETNKVNDIWRRLNPEKLGITFRYTLKYGGLNTSI